MPAPVIVEGTCGSGKTTLLRAAAATLGPAEVRVLLQRETYAPVAVLEDAGTLDDASNHRILRELVGEIRGEVAAGRLVLADTLHATHFARAGALSVDSFVAIDRELAELDAVVVVLQIGEAAIHERAIAGRRGTGFYAYASKFGATERDRTAYFVREQQRMLELLHAHSRLRCVVLDGERPAEALQAELRRVASQLR